VSRWHTWGEMPLSEVSKADLMRFSMHLKKERQLVAKTINNFLAAGTVAFRWARANEMLAVDPSAALMKLAGKPATREILVEEEVEKLFISA
jgi:site-specific recombinase XerD